jgi:hypothetical protein
LEPAVRKRFYKRINTRIDGRPAGGGREHVVSWRYRSALNGFGMDVLIIGAPRSGLYLTR